MMDGHLRVAARIPSKTETPKRSRESATLFFRSRREAEYGAKLRVGCRIRRRAGPGGSRGACGFGLSALRPRECAYGRRRRREPRNTSDRRRDPPIGRLRPPERPSLEQTEDLCWNDARGG